MRAQSEASPLFPGNISPKQGSAALAGESSLAANATVTWPEREQMIARLAELEAAMAELPPPPAPGIGHNNPPPLDIAELEEIKNEIALLKAQLPPAPAKANSIASKWVRLAERVAGYVNNFMTEFSKSAGHEAGKAVVQLPKWLMLGSGLMASAAAIMQWVTTLIGQ